MTMPRSALRAEEQLDDGPDGRGCEHHGDGTGTALPRRRRSRAHLLGIRFDHQVEIYYTITREDITKKEREAAWFTDDDWARMKNEAKAAVLKAHLSASRRAEGADEGVGADNDDDNDNDDNESSLCIRGLEHNADAASLIKREKRRRKAERAVLSAPSGSSDEDVARASRKATSKNRKAAVELGARDAAAAARVHAESIRDQAEAEAAEENDGGYCGGDASVDYKTETAANAEEEMEAARQRSRGRHRPERRHAASHSTATTSSSREPVMSVDDIVRRVGELTVDFAPPPKVRERSRSAPPSSSDETPGRVANALGGQQAVVVTKEDEAEEPSLAASSSSTEGADEKWLRRKQRRRQEEAEERAAESSQRTQEGRRRRERASSSTVPASEMLGRIRDIAGEFHPEARRQTTAAPDDADADEEAAAAAILDRVRSIAGRHFADEIAAPSAGRRTRRGEEERTEETTKQRQGPAAGAALLERSGAAATIAWMMGR